ncbi:hypothetical protein ACQP3F_31880, partial [Escherichia coli]
FSAARFIYSFQSCLAPISNDNEMAPVLVVTNRCYVAGPEVSLCLEKKACHWKAMGWEGHSTKLPQVPG